MPTELRPRPSANKGRSINPYTVAAGVLIAAVVVISGRLYLDLWSLAHPPTRDERDIVWGPKFCEVADWSMFGNLTVSCEGDLYEYRNLLVTVSYLAKPGPLVCAVLRGGELDCEPRPLGSLEQ